MISSTTNKHEKHAKLARTLHGNWGRNELAILGTDCDGIRQLAMAIIKQLPEYKIAFIDADHKNDEAAMAEKAAINNGAFAELTNKISYTQFNISTQLNSFQNNILLNDCDLILVNGNHFSATRQIVVIDDRKLLQKKLEKLTDVQIILLADPSADTPPYLINQVPNINQLPRFSINDTEAIGKHIKQQIQLQIPAINGLVLSGGQSTRMGRDKGSLAYYNKSQREYVFTLLSAYCSEVFISCNANQVKQVVNLPSIEDSFLNLGPLGGILSAFQHNPNAAWLTVACDLPLLNESTINHLINRRNPSKMATAFWDAEGRFPEPLVTIWEPKVYLVLLQFLAQGYSCPRKALINSDVEMLVAPDAFAFTNVNTTEDYHEVISMLNKKA